MELFPRITLKVGIASLNPSETMNQAHKNLRMALNKNEISNNNNNKVP